MSVRGEIVSLSIPPGINRQGTAMETQGRWRDCDGVRFYQGLVIPRGGRELTGMTPLAGRVCGAHSWIDNDGAATLSCGTADKLFVTQSQFDGPYSDITPVEFVAGRDDSARQYGYGIGAYGAENYGDERQIESAVGGRVSSAQTWFLDNRGQDLYALAPSDGKIYVWTPPDAGTLAEPLANAPVDNLGMVVTPQNHVMALGAGGDPRKISWSDNVDPTNWSPDLTNQSGFIQLEDDSAPVGGISFRRSVLAWTRSHAFEIRQAPQPFWFQPIKIRNAGIVSPRAWASDGISVAWMGFKNFWIYDGATARTLPCEVHDYVFSRLNSVQLAKVHAAHLPEFSEFTWYYPAETADITHFVTWNYLENHWTIGTSDVTAYLAQSTFDYNLSWDLGGSTYAEEQNYNTSGFLESSDTEIAAGRDIIRLQCFIPDWTVRITTAPELERKSTWEIYGKDAPRAKHKLLVSQEIVDNTEPRFYIRGQSRILKSKFSFPGGYYWELGDMRVAVSKGARRA